MLFKFSIFVLIFCKVVLAIIKSRVVEYQTITVKLPIFTSVLSVLTSCVWGFCY